MPRTAAETFQPHAPGPGETVINRRIIAQQGGDDIEERLFYTVGDRPGRLIRFRRQQASSPKLSRDNPHPARAYTGAPYAATTCGASAVAARARTWLPG